MRSSRISFLPFVAQAAFVACAPTASSEPCAQVSAILADKTSPTTPKGLVIIDPDTAYACLKSVPVDTKGDLLQLRGLQTALNFQSDTAFQKDPTPGWLYPGVNLDASLAAIIQNVQNGSYESEYDVQLDISNLVSSGYDFHLVYQPDITQVLNWVRDIQLVSISTKQGSLPDVYAGQDIHHLVATNQTDYTPSPVTQINGTDVETYLNQFAALNPWDHDPDTNYNNVFINVPLTSGQSAGGTYGGGNMFSQGFLRYPGSVTTISFANGSTTTIATYAILTPGLDFTGVTDGASFFKAFCSGPPSSSASASTAIPIASSSVAPSGTVTASITQAPPVTTNNLYTPIPTASAQTSLAHFPEPLDIASDVSIAGYFPEAEKDLLVIQIPTFSPASDYEFQNVFRSSLATAKSQGKTKLLIDLRGNGGGNVVDGYSLFTELFPSMTPLGLGTLAAWPLLDAMGLVASSMDYSDIQALLTLSSLDVIEDLNVSDQDYDSWADFYGPVQHNGGNFTNVRRYNFSDPHAAGSPVYGFGDDNIPQPQTFEPENIVILSDGFCGSTCAIFSELMKTQGGVKSIAVGGRKQNCAMQPVGGSKGSNDQHLTYIGHVMFGLYQNATTQEEKALFEPYVQADLQDTYVQMLGRTPYWRSDPPANINWINNLRKDDSSATPLMFVYEAANCRFFYTPQMMADQSLVWSAAYNLQWGNGTCIPGSTDQPSAQPGFSTSYINSPPPTCASNYFGADLSWSYAGYGAGVSSSPSPSSSNSSSTVPPATSGSASPTSRSAASGRMLSVGACLLTILVCGLLV